MTATRIARHPLVIISAITALSLAAGGLWAGWADLFSTPDQRGRGHMERGRYDEAAASFHNPLWRGAALFRAGQFKEAAEVFGGIDTAEAAYDQGNALVMLGKYEDAVHRYDRALVLHPGWRDAEENRKLAQVRADRMKTEGGDTGSTDSAPDEIVFDRSKKAGEGQDDEVAGGQAMTDEAARALWLANVRTRPADFLRAKFAYQLQSPGSTP
jgi:Ca-activated chloride channel homolog